MFRPPTSKPKRHLILDIDGTLATAYSDYKSPTNIVKIYPRTPYAAKPHAFIHSPYPHLLHPGALEFIQFAAQKFDLISFFSSGSHVRNFPFVDAYLTRALGEKYDADIEKFDVFSKHHMTHRQKDLSKLKRTADLDNTILVDDRPHNIAPGQNRNVLITHGADGFDFKDLHTNCSYNRYYCSDCKIHTILHINHLFYVTGMLKRALEMPGKNLADSLLALQYKLADKQTYQLNTDLFNDVEIYREGLAELKKFNPSLEFYGGSEAQKLLQPAAKKLLRI